MTSATPAFPCPHSSFGRAATQGRPYGTGSVPLSREREKGEFKGERGTPPCPWQETEGFLHLPLSAMASATPPFPCRHPSCGRAATQGRPYGTGSDPFLP